MAEFITRKAIVHHIGRIIKEADKEIILISPYINADDETKKLIADTRRSVTIHVIYGKREKLTQNERGFFDERSVKLSYRKDLHAKCYLNEKEAIVTSMNLYEYSQLHNDEMGILVSREDDPKLYKAIYEQAMEWKERSSGVDASATGRRNLTWQHIQRYRSGVDAPATGRRNAGAEKTRKEATQTEEAPFDGFCIRCKVDVRGNLNKPYCTRCYTSWNRYKNEAYEENYCHICGSEYTTTILEPLCLACYRELKDVLEFIAF